MLFQDYFVIGSLVISGAGAGMFLLDRSKLYDWAAAISLVGFVFPFLYIMALFQPGRFVWFDIKFDLFSQAPPLVMSALNVLWAYPTFIGDLRSRKLAVNYALLSITTFLGAIYALPALFSFAMSLAGSSVFAVVSYGIYRADRERGMKRKRVLEAIEGKGEATLEDLMEELRLGDAEVDSLLYELWMDDLVEKEETTGQYRVKRE